MTQNKRKTLILLQMTLLVVARTIQFINVCKNVLRQPDLHGCFACTVGGTSKFDCKVQTYSGMNHLYMKHPSAGFICRFMSRFCLYVCVVCSFECTDKAEKRYMSTIPFHHLLTGRHRAAVFMWSLHFHPVTV